MTLYGEGRIYSRGKFNIFVRNKSRRSMDWTLRRIFIFEFRTRTTLIGTEVWFLWESEALVYTLNAHSALNLTVRFALYVYHPSWSYLAHLQPHYARCPSPFVFTFECDFHIRYMKLGITWPYLALNAPSNTDANIDSGNRSNKYSVVFISEQAFAWCVLRSASDIAEL